MTTSSAARPTGHPGYSETLPCEAPSAETARRLVRTALAAWGLGRIAEDGALVVTELVANAVSHAKGHQIRLVVARTSQDTVRVGVVDKSRSRPLLRHPAEADVHGRGLALVDALTTRWGTDLEDQGKCVWAELTASSQ